MVYTIRVITSIVQDSGIDRHVSISKIYHEITKIIKHEKIP